MRESWGNVLYILVSSTHAPLSFSSYNTSPHRKIINRWVGWEQLPVRASMQLGKQESVLWFPCSKQGGQASAWLLIHYPEPEKLVRNHRYLSLLSQDLLYTSTPLYKSGHINVEIRIKKNLSLCGKYSRFLGQQLQIKDKRLPACDGLCFTSRIIFKQIQRNLQQLCLSPILKNTHKPLHKTYTTLSSTIHSKRC